MEWHYLENQFDNVTVKSNLKMVILTNDHLARLKAQQADPDILELFNRTSPFHNAFLTAYSTSKSSMGLRKAATLALTNKLGLLRSTKLRHWDAMVQVEFLSGSQEYVAIFPNGLTAFHTSTIDQTIIMLKGLTNRMADYVVLDPVRTQIDTFYTELKDLRDDQQVKEQIIEQSSSLLEQARKNLATIMFGNLGVLMDKYKDTPEFVGNYWELQLLQTHSKASEETKTEEYTGTVAAGETTTVVASLTGITTAVLTNTGSATLRFCATDNAATVCDVNNSIELPAGAVYEASAADFDNPENKLLNVTNIGAEQGSFYVELVRNAPEASPGA